MTPANNRSDLKKNYTILLETGLIISLLIFLAATKLPIGSASSDDLTLAKEQEAVNMKEVERTSQQQKPPAPPRPPVPVEVPNDQVIPDNNLNIDAELRIDKKIKMPESPGTGKEEEKEEDFFVVVEQMPELIDGLAALQKKIRYPEKARRAGIEGRVIVEFIVNKDGTVEDPHVVRGIGGGCDEEAVRAVSQSIFRPGRQRGEPVRVQYSLPVLFKLKNH